MKEIELTQGYKVQVDDEDLDYLAQWKWHVYKAHGSLGACRTENNHKIWMHRVIMKTPDDLEVDHKDRNQLNCQKDNMRNCTHQQNMCNQMKRGEYYKGVYCIKGKNRFGCKIKVNGKGIYLGCFKTEEDAARVYNEAAIIHFGEFACPNIVEEVS